MNDDRSVHTAHCQTGKVRTRFKHPFGGPSRLCLLLVQQAPSMASAKFKANKNKTNLIYHVKFITVLSDVFEG